MEGKVMSQEERIVFVVDDDEVCARRLSKLLASRRFKIETFSTGEAALERMQSLKPHIVLLDIIMPGLSGIDVLKAIRMDFSALDLPVIMVTAQDNLSNMVECFRAGANDYVTKPIHAEEISTRISTHLNLMDIHLECLDLSEYYTIASTLTVVSFEINNPLTIAIGYIERALQRNPSTELEKTKVALIRIAEVMQRIERLTGGKFTEEKDIESLVKKAK